MMYSLPIAIGTDQLPLSICITVLQHNMRFDIYLSASIKTKRDNLYTY